MGYHRSTTSSIGKYFCLATLVVFASRFVLTGSVHRAFLQHQRAWSTFAEFWDNFENGVTDSGCKRDLLRVVRNLQTEEWAMKMVDAWAKPQTGILTGNSMHLGNFDECISIDFRSNHSENIRGQYCSAFIQPNDQSLVDILVTRLHGIPTNPSGKKSGLINILDKFRLSWGICVPTSCSTQNLDEAWMFTKNYFNLTWDVDFKADFCDYDGKYELTDFAYFTIFFLCCLLSVVIIGTVYHVFVANNSNDPAYKKGERNAFLMNFSAYTNSKKILNGTTNDPLAVLNAVRVLSLSWILIRHYFMLVFYFPHLNAMDMNAWKSEYGNMFILSGSMAVDSFFTAGGLSVAYLFFKSRETEEFNLFRYCIHKLIRVTPTLVLVVLIYSSLLIYLGNGPFWHIIYNLFQRDCENNWWSSVLFIANYAHPTGHCLTQSWYLSADVQLHILAPLLLIPLVKWPKPTVIGIILLMLASLAQCFLDSWTLNLGSTHFDENAHFHTNIVATHIRAPSWLIGFLVGYLLYRIKDESVKLKQSTVILLWLISISTFLIIIFGHQSVASNEYNVLRSSTFNTLVRPAWSIALSWVIFACIKGYGGVVKKILTAPIFNIIIKINFNMFLLHVLPQIYFIGQTRTSTYFNNRHNVYLVLADWTGALMLAFVWTLIVDPWIVVMERLFLSKEPKEANTYKASLLLKDDADKGNNLNYVTTEKDLIKENKNEKEYS